MRLWNKSKGQWYSKKELGNLYPNKKHPDYLRDKLNRKGMKKLKRQDMRAEKIKKKKVMSRLKGLKFRGLFFYLGIPPDEPITLMFPKWKTGWLSTQMNEYLFLGYCYLSWSM